MMHEESPSERNSFLEDLDKLDVSIYGGNYTELQLDILYSLLSFYIDANIVSEQPEP